VIVASSLSRNARREWMMNEVWSQMAEGAVAGPKGEPFLDIPGQSFGARRPAIHCASFSMTRRAAFSPESSIPPKIGPILGPAKTAAAAMPATNSPG